YDCTGNEVGDNKTLINVFTTKDGGLWCSAYIVEAGGTYTPNGSAELVNGIDRLHILYGINTLGRSDSANQYVSADRVDSLNKWSEVRSIRIAVLANSMKTVSPAPPSRPYVLLDAAPMSFDDNWARQVFTTTIQLKNIN